MATTSCTGLIFRGYITSYADFKSGTLKLSCRTEARLLKRLSCDCPKCLVLLDRLYAEPTLLSLEGIYDGGLFTAIWQADALILLPIPERR